LLLFCHPIKSIAIVVAVDVVLLFLLVFSS
jgi:hypothetical protein